MRGATDELNRGFVAGMLFVCLMLGIFIGGMVVGEGVGRRAAEAIEKEGER
jgi:hypothetical protein